jgi:galactonate dehydratase
MAAILPFLSGRCYDIVMPDILLAGGPAEVMRIGHLADRLGTAVSLHNPCGPVMDAHSLHAAAALPQFHSLERQFQESPLYDAVVARRDFRLDGGRLTVPDTPGLGLDLEFSHDSLRHHGTWTIGL